MPRTNTLAYFVSPSATKKKKVLWDWHQISLHRTEREKNSNVVTHLGNYALRMRKRIIKTFLMRNLDTSLEGNMLWHKASKFVAHYPIHLITASFRSLIYLTPQFNFTIILSASFHLVLSKRILFCINTFHLDEINQYWTELKCVSYSDTQVKTQLHKNAYLSTKLNRNNQNLMRFTNSRES